jgi:hypothetical protein
MLYSEILIDEPLEKIADDWDYLNERVVKRFYGFKDVGDNVVGIRSIETDNVVALGQKAVPIALPAIRTNYEIGPKGLVVVPRIPFSAHVTLAGTPHRTEHVFGYWHINDKDEVIMPLPADDKHPPRIIIIMGRPTTGRETDRFAWYCSECLTLLFMRESSDFDTFFQTELAAVREYNAEPKNQLCPTCGHKNPLGYSGMQRADRPDERAARFVW